jgi:hypothetical protein
MVAACLLSMGFAEPSAAQTCVGDCMGEGRVSISDLILAVNIVLGVAPLDQCPSLGPAPVGIDRLILSVNNALCDCSMCPTPPPPRTSTATATAAATATHTPTPTASPTPMAVVSTWRENNFKLASSTCPKEFNDQLRRLLAGVTSTYTVRQRGGNVELEDEDGNLISGTIDPDGNVEASTVITDMEDQCILTFDVLLTVNLRSSPSTATYTGGVTTMFCPVSVDCSLQVTSRWTRTSAALRAHGSVLGALRGVFAPVSP